MKKLALPLAAMLALLSIAGCAQYYGKGKAPPPVVTWLTVDGHCHALSGAIDVDDDGGAGASRQRDNKYQPGQNAVQATHDRDARRPQHFKTT